MRVFQLGVPIWKSSKLYVRTHAEGKTSNEHDCDRYDTHRFLHGRFLFSLNSCLRK